MASSNVVVLHEVMARSMARELGVSLEFVEACREIGISPKQAVALMRWFLTRPMNERVIIMRSVLRSNVAKARLRAKPVARPQVEPPTRELLIRSFEAAEARANVDGAVTLNPASYAGHLLVTTGGDIARAVERLPAGAEGVFWSAVRAHLDRLAREESPP